MTQNILPGNALEQHLPAGRYIVGVGSGDATVSGIAFIRQITFVPSTSQQVGPYQADTDALLRAFAGGLSFDVLGTAGALSLLGSPAVNATIGSVYSFLPTIAGGQAPYTVTASAALPSGLSLNAATGAISGTLSGSPATYSGISLHVADFVGAVADLALPSIVVSAPSATLTITGTPATTATVGTPYNAAFSAAGGAGGNVFSLVGGALPPGLALNAGTGAISGTPTTPGAVSGLAVRVTDSAGATATAATFAITVASGVATLTIGGTPATSATVGVSYSFTPTTSGGAGGNVFAISAGSLPAGLSISSSTGAITGTPTTAGASSGIVVRVTDSASATASLGAFTLTVSASAADTKPKFGYAAANATGDATALSALFATMTDLTGSANAGRAGTFVTTQDTTKYTWVAVLHSAAPSGITINDGTGTGGFSGAQSSGLFSGSDTTPTTISVPWTDSGGNVWNFYRSNGKASNSPTLTLS